MKIQDAIERLENLLHTGETDVMLEFNSRTSWEEVSGQYFNKENWSNVCTYVENNMSFSEHQEDIQQFIEEGINQEHIKVGLNA